MLRSRDFRIRLGLVAGLLVALALGQAMAAPEGISPPVSEMPELIPAEVSPRATDRATLQHADPPRRLAPPPIGGQAVMRQTDPVADRDVVLHAGGTIELEVPSGWQVREFPDGRAVRLMVSSGEVPPEPQQMIRGLWLSHEPLESAELSTAVDMKDALARRLRRGAGDGLRIPAEAEATSIAGIPAWQQAFTTKVSTDQGPVEVSGYHMLARTGAGLLEIHAVAPQQDPMGGVPPAAEVLNSLRLSSPRRKPPVQSPTVQDAEGLVGSWKAIRSRWSFTPKGRVVVGFDRGATFRLNESGTVQYDKPALELMGSFRSEGDMLYITWDDASRQNVRWRIHRGDLLMTDHHGRVSQLAPLFD